MLTTDKQPIARLVHDCIQAGVVDVVISPGSRNAPLIIALEAHPDMTTYLVHDERSAAFFALGIAEAQQRAVALTCTSGSALLNYSPALVEAYYRQIPLLVLSADRPVELIDQGEGQTMRQAKVYRNFVKASFALPNHDVRNRARLSEKTTQRALHQLQAPPQGPVHINIPLAEPLYGKAPQRRFTSKAPPPSPARALSKRTVRQVGKKWQKREKKLILVGQQGFNPLLVQRLSELARDPSVAILVENTAHVQDDAHIVHCIDRTLAAIRPNEIHAFQPELLLTIGGAVISKRIKAFLRTYPPVENWRVGVYPVQEDTYQSITRRFEVAPIDFLNQLPVCHSPSPSNFGVRWKQKDRSAEQCHRRYLQTAGFSDLKAVATLLDAIPDQTALHMGNSAVVRYCQLFDPSPSVRYYANRGVSGIDGSASTAVGFAVAEPTRLHTLVIGDTSFFYDSNAFWNRQLNANLRIVVINNGGGGIFQIIDGPTASGYVETFVAPFSAEVRGICTAYNMTYLKADSAASLATAVEQLFRPSSEKRPVLLEITTAGRPNAEVLSDYFEAIRAAHKAEE